MITTTFSNTQSEGGDLGLADVNAGRPGARLRFDTVMLEQRDDRLLDAADQALDADTEPQDVEQTVNHQLAGTVVGDLPAAIDLHHGYVAGRQQVLLAAVQTLGKNRLVLGEPQFIGGIGVAPIGKLPHRHPGFVIVGQSHFPDQHDADPGVIVTLRPVRSRKDPGRFPRAVAGCKR